LGSNRAHPYTGGGQHVRSRIIAYAKVRGAA